MTKELIFKKEELKEKLEEIRNNYVLDLSVEEIYNKVIKESLIFDFGDKVSLDKEEFEKVIKEII